MRMCKALTETQSKKPSQESKRYKETATCRCACHVSALYNKMCIAGCPNHNHQLTFIRKSTIITNNMCAVAVSVVCGARFVHTRIGNARINNLWIKKNGESADCLSLVRHHPSRHIYVHDIVLISMLNADDLSRQITTISIWKLNDLSCVADSERMRRVPFHRHRRDILLFFGSSVFVWTSASQVEFKFGINFEWFCEFSIY